MKKILIVVDIQQGFVRTPATKDIQHNVDSLISTGAFDVVISTVYENFENSPISRLMGWNDLMTKEEQQLQGRAKTDCDYVVHKNTYSAVNEQMLQVLREIGGGELPPCVYVVGVDTECCVLSTATNFFELGIRPIVMTQYCGSSCGLSYHQAGLLSMVNLIGRNNIWDGWVESAETLEQAYEEAVQGSLPGTAQSALPEQLLVDRLTERNWHIAFSESCTGGLAVAKLVSVPSASHVLEVSHVTYSNSAKTKFLGVLPETLASHGAVSEEVAREMATGAAEKNCAQVGVGISGIAGPGGGTAEKPVGMVCFGFYINGTVTTCTKYFGACGRNRVREASVAFVYDKLNELLDNGTR